MWEGAAISPIKENDENDQAAAGLGIAATGLGVAFFGGLSLGYGLLWRDGSSSTHEISKFDADLYAARYNRALLRNTVRDTESRMRRLQSSVRPIILQPVVSPTFTGLMGVF